MKKEKKTNREKPASCPAGTAAVGLTAAAARSSAFVPLVSAVAVIKAWHNMGLSDANLQMAWRIYWRNAPEMAPIRVALPGVNLDDPEKLLEQAR